METINIQSCNISSERINETNDCAVKALAITLQIPYKEAHAYMAKFGRKSRKGANGMMVLKTLTIANNKANIYDLTKVKTTVGEFGSRMTPRVFARVNPKGHYFCFTRNHAIAIVNGVVEDWTANRNHQIKAFIEVEPNL